MNHHFFFLVYLSNIGVCNWNKGGDFELFETLVWIAVAQKHWHYARSQPVRKENIDCLSVIRGYSLVCAWVCVGGESLHSLAVALLAIVNIPFKRREKDTIHQLTCLEYL